MKAPNLNNGEYSVISAEFKTGIILTTNFQRHIGNGDVFHIFQSYELAIDFIDEKLTKSSYYEFNVYNSKGEYLLTKDKDGKR